MLEHCDFDEQVTSQSETGRLRPDVVVRLSGGRNVVVDAKVPLQAFLEAMEAQDEGDPQDGPDRTRSPAAITRRRSFEEGLLAAVRRHTGIRDRLHSRRPAPCSRPGA